MKGSRLGLSGPALAPAPCRIQSRLQDVLEEVVELLGRGKSQQRAAVDVSAGIP
jgi:hypothetical protein